MFRIRGHQKYLYSIIKTILLISILPVILLGIMSYRSSSSAIESKVLKVNEQLLVQTRMRFEQTLKIVYNYYVLLGDKDVISDNLERDLTYTDVDVIPDIQSKLMELQNLQSIVKSAALVNLQRDWVVSNEGFEQSISEDYRRYVEKGMNSPKNIFWSYQPEENEKVSLFIKVPYNMPEQSGAIIVDFDYSDFQSFFVDDEGYEIIVLDEAGYVVYSQDHDQLGMKAADNIYGTQVYGQYRDQGYFRTLIKNEEMMVLFEPSDYNGWTYLMIYSIDELTKEVEGIRNLTFILVAVLLMLIVLLTFFSSRKLYSPVKDIYSNIRNLEDSCTDGHLDEMHYIGREVDFMIDRQKMMQQQLDRQIRQIEELFMLKMIKGELKSEDIQVRSENIGKFHDYTFYSLIMVQVDKGMVQCGREQDEEMQLLLLYNTVIEYLEGTNLLTPIIRDGVVVILYDGNKKDNADFKEDVFVFTYELRQKIQERLDYEVVIGISNRYHDPEQVQVAYKESLEAVMCKDSMEDSILFYEEVQPGKVIRVIYPKNLEGQMLQAVNRGDLEKAESLLDDMLDQIFDSYVGYNEHKVYVNRLLISLVNLLQDSGISVQTIFDKTDNVLEEIIRLSQKEEIKVWFKTKLLRPMTPMLAEQRTSRSYLLIQEIVQMIENEYDQDISLEICASRLNYHPSHIWKVMKQEMDMSFTDYLMAYRLKVAKELLVDTNETINHIADKLRYTNAQNFIRYFKKLEGVTPGQYRKKHQI